MTNTKRKHSLQETNPVKDRIRYRRRLQEEQEADRTLKEELTRTTEQEKEDDEPIF